MTFRAFFVGWNRFWCREAPPHAMAIVRIGFALFLGFHWALKLPFVPMLLSREGVIVPAPVALPGWLAFLGVAPPAWLAWAVFSVFLIAMLCVVAGFLMRTAIIVLLLCYAHYWVLWLHLFWASYERLFVFLLVALLVSGADRAFSLRMRLRHGSWFAWEPASVLAQRLVAVQMSATYLGVGWQKLALVQWRHGEVLAHSFAGLWSVPASRWLIRLNLPMAAYDALNEGVKFFEFLLPVGLWVPRVQWLFFGLGAAFHVLIAVLMGIWWFLILIPAYIVFLPPETAYRWCRRAFPGRIR